MRTIKGTPTWAYALGFAVLAPVAAFWGDDRTTAIVFLAIAAALMLLYALSFLFYD